MKSLQTTASQAKTCLNQGQEWEKAQIEEGWQPTWTTLIRRKGEGGKKMALGLKRRRWL